MFQFSYSKTNLISSNKALNKSMSGLKGKVVLITGASSGIGEGTALHMATLGCKLSLIARNMEALKAVSEKCKESGSPDVFLASHDLAEEKECIAAINETVEHFGGNEKTNVTSVNALSYG